MIRKFTEIYPGRPEYTPAAPLPGGRDLAARLPGGRDLNAKKRRKKIADRSLGPVARQRGGRPPLAARQLGGRPPATLYKVFAPSPPFGLLKIRKKRREREGEEG